jgi:hypothetical protein
MTNSIKQHFDIFECDLKKENLAHEFLQYD